MEQANDPNYYGGDPNRWYRFTDKDGNVHTSRGDNGYVWQALESGVPMSVNKQGEWYVTPYMEVENGNVITHMPNWFKETNEYQDWYSIASRTSVDSLTDDTFSQLNDLLRSYGNQGAVRMGTYKQGDQYGITDPGEKQKLADDYISILVEGGGGDKANLSLSGHTGSVADIAREFKAMSKEDLSSYMTGISKILDNETSEEFSQEAKREVLTLRNLLNVVNNNPDSFGKEGEFKGLLEASEGQKFLSAFMNASQAFMESVPIANLVPRTMFGWEKAMQGGDFGEGFQIERRREEVGGPLLNPYTGYMLEGTETSQIAGNVVGMIGATVTTAAMSNVIGKAIEGAAGAAKGGTFLARTGQFMQTLPGSMAFDFVTNDLPMDLALFASDISRTGSIERAWYNEEERGPLFGFFGPEAPTGLATNLLADALVDLVPVLGVANKAVWKGLDDITGGAITRTREWGALQGLRFQKFVSEIPGVGTGLKKLGDWYYGPVKAEAIRRAKNAAIIEGSITPYIDMQNALTTVNHRGAPAVAPLFKRLREDYNIDDQIKHFQKNANQYGGMGKTTIEYPHAKTPGRMVTESIDDDLPRQVKQGLLDIERLSELRGEMLGEGEVLTNPKRDKEIAELTKRVEALPQEIKDFARDFSDLNKEVERLSAVLGLTTEEWIDALNEDARWADYMTRQTMVPGGGSPGSYDPTESKIWTKSRTGFYEAERYISPTQALNMKVDALGRAYAWNEMAKLVVANEKVLGNIKADAGDVAKRLQEVKADIRADNNYRIEAKIDKATDTFSKRSDKITEAFTAANEQLHRPEQLAAEAVFVKSEDPRLGVFRSDYRAGKITWAEGVGDDLTPGIKNDIVNNTYRMGGEVTEDITPSSYAGVTAEGVPYEYTIVDNKITSITEVTSTEGLAESVNGVSGGRCSIGAESVERIGKENVAAINQGIMSYRDNMPEMPFKVEFLQADRYHGKDQKAYGWVPHPKSSDYDWKIENGHITGHLQVYLGPDYKKENRAELLESKKDATKPKNGQVPFHPKNSGTDWSTPVHEMGHNYTIQLTIAEMNRKIDAGELKVAGDIVSNADGSNAMPIGRAVWEANGELEERLLNNALKAAGYDIDNMTPKQIQRALTKEGNKISGYASQVPISRGRNVRYASGNNYRGEIFSESMVNYIANGGDISPFCSSIVSQMHREGGRFAIASNPGKVFKENGLNAPRGLFKADGSYNFPTSVKTDAQKGKWLDAKRQKNPYLKGEFTDDTFAKAHRYDSFFQKEIAPLGYASMAPGTLIKKSGDYYEKIRNEAVDIAMKQLKEIGFDQDLATLVFSHSATDVTEALDNFVIKEVEKMSKELDTATPGEAKLLAWSSDTVKEKVTEMVAAMSPSGDMKAIEDRIDRLFSDQASGYAAYDRMPDANEMLSEQERLTKQLKKENKQAQKIGKKLDESLGAYSGDATHMVHYKQGGEDVWVATSDPIVAQLLKNPYSYKELGVGLETATAVMNFISTGYRLGTTGLNPIALIQNVLRDPMRAYLTAGSDPFTMSLNPHSFYNTLRQYGLDDDTINYVTERISNWASSSTMTKQMRIGEKQSSYRNRAEKFANNLKKVSDTKIVRMGQAPLEAWEKMSRNAIGMQEFEKTLKRTGDVDKAMGAALFVTSNATTDFSHAIGKFNRAIATVPYLSSAINGTASFWRMFTIDPIGVTARIVGGFMVPVMAITAWNLSTDENREVYEHLPEWFKQGHLMLVDPTSKTVFSIPIDAELQQFAGMARMLMEYTNEASPFNIPNILAQGAFGFLPVDVSGFFSEDGSINVKRGWGQLASGLFPQAFTAIYEWCNEQDLFTGADLSGYNELQKWVNLGTNIFGTGFKQLWNDVGMMLGIPAELKVGRTTAETIARNLFGQGMDAAKDQFMSIVGRPESVAKNGKIIKASGLFAENEQLQARIESLNKQIAYASDEEKPGLEKQKQDLIDTFVTKVGNLMRNYNNLFQQTGGLEDWQKNRLIQVLTLGNSWAGSGAEGSYQSEEADTAALSERGLAIQRYIQAGLPAGPTESNLAGTNSIEIQAALNRFYGAPKQAATDFRTAVKESNLKDIRTEFYNAVSKIYDYADEHKIKPDYDLIEKIQARYLQAVDASLIPIINQYGIAILNNSDFIETVNNYVNGMIPSDDWRRSTKNAKKYLSSKEFPTATVDVKKWLIQRYSSGLRNRGIDSDSTVTEQLESIKNDIDAGRMGAAKGKIQSLMNGINKANFYISSKDFQTLTELNNMVK